MTIHVVSKYFAHESGTKFYEVVQMWDADISVFQCVRRWGKVNTLGEVQVFSFPNHRKMEADAEKIMTQKRGRGYHPAAANYGLHGINTITDGTLTQVLTKHYGVGNAPKVAYEFNKIQGREATMAVLDEASDIVVEEPPPEPERGESWGSW